MKRSCFGLVVLLVLVVGIACEDDRSSSRSERLADWTVVSKEVVVVPIVSGDIRMGSFRVIVMFAGAERRLDYPSFGEPPCYADAHLGQLLPRNCR